MILLVTDMAVMRGGVQTVNQLFRDVAHRQRIAGVIVARHDSPDAVWLKDWPGSYGAAGSAPRLLAGALRRAHHARASVILATHIGLAPLGHWLRRVSGGRFYMFLHGVEAWGLLPRATRWGLRACDAFVTNSHFTLDKFRAAHAEFAAVPGTVCYLPAQLTPSTNAATERKRDGEAREDERHPDDQRLLEIERGERVDVVHVPGKRHVRVGVRNP